MAKKKPYRYPLYLLARGVAFTVSLLPRRLFLPLAALLGRLAYYLVPRHRRGTLRNLKCAYGNSKTETEIRRIAREVFENLAKTSAEILLFPKLDLAQIESFVDAGNADEVYSKLLAEGRGLISITSHIGNWELLAGIFALKGRKGKAIARKVRYEPYNRWIERLRLSVGVGTIYRGDSPLEIMRTLKQGYIIGMLPDQDIDSLRGVFVDFFGRPAYTTVAPVKISLATGAPILTNFLIRMPGNRYKVIIGDVIRPAVETTKEEAVEKYTAQWMKSCEKVIREYPGQWGWMHNRWKTQKKTSGGSV